MYVMCKSWIWTNLGGLVFSGNFRVGIKVRVEVRVIVRVRNLRVCIGDPWFVQI